ncbi:hypothetical protein WDZ92_39615 [Nostoc sp. NIES-2111]
MRTISTILSAAVLATMLASAPARADALPDLQGGWTDASLSCTDVFSTSNGKLVLRNDDGFNVGGFIVEGNKIKGQARACTVDRSVRKGSTINLLMSCQDSVLASAQEIRLKLNKDGTVTRTLAGFKDFSQTFKRCPAS